MARALPVGQIGDWPVQVPLPGSRPLPGRVAALPLPLAQRARRRAEHDAAKKQRRVHPDTIEAARYVLLFTALPAERLSAAAVLELHRDRGQVELAFKWLKQLLRIGRLPHQHPGAAAGWIQAKRVVALLLETRFRSARIFPLGATTSKPGQPAERAPNRGRCQFILREGLRAAYPSWSDFPTCCRIGY